MSTASILRAFAGLPIAAMAIFLTQPVLAQLYLRDPVTGKETLTWPSGTHYEGMVVSNRAMGEGVMTWPAGPRAEGTFVNNSLHGKGVLRFPNGDVHEGQFENSRLVFGTIVSATGQRQAVDRRNASAAGATTATHSTAATAAATGRNGHGVANFESGERYEGEFRNGKYHGAGTYTWPSGQRYEGEWANGLYHGKGTLLSANGRSYNGEWLAGKRNGTGVSIGLNGTRYEGQFLDDKASGTGVLTWAGGRYEGEHLNGNYEGKGKLTLSNGMVYEGDFINDKLVYGTALYPSGDKYEGTWTDGKMTGRGVFTYWSGDRYEGYMVDGVREGWGEMRYTRGDYYVGEWRKGERVGYSRDELAKRNSGISAQVVAGLIGAAVIGSASGLSGVEKAQAVTGFLADVATDGQARGIQSAMQDIRAGRTVPVQIQQQVAAQQQAAAESRRARQEAEQLRATRDRERQASIASAASAAPGGQPSAGPPPSLTQAGASSGRPSETVVSTAGWYPSLCATHDVNETGPMSRSPYGHPWARVSRAQQDSKLGRCETREALASRAQAAGVRRLAERGADIVDQRVACDLGRGGYTVAQYGWVCELYVKAKLPNGQWVNTDIFQSGD